jgi:hypothetical protein
MNATCRRKGLTPMLNQGSACRRPLKTELRRWDAQTERRQSSGSVLRHRTDEAHRCTAGLVLRLRTRSAHQTQQRARNQNSVITETRRSAGKYFNPHCTREWPRSSTTTLNFNVSSSVDRPML